MLLQDQKKLHSPHDGSTYVLYVLRELKKLLTMLESEATYGHQNRYLDLWHGEESDYTTIYKWASEGSCKNQMEFFNDDTTPRTMVEIRSMLIWMIQIISSEPEGDTIKFCLEPRNVIKPFMDVVHSTEIPMEVLVASLSSIEQFLDCKFIDCDKYCLRYITNRLISSFRLREYISPNNPKSKQNVSYDYGILRILKCIMSRDSYTDIFDMWNTWIILESCIESGFHHTAKDQILDIIKFIVPIITKKLEKCWDTVKLQLNVVINNIENDKLIEHEFLKTSSRIDPRTLTDSNKKSLVDESEPIINSFADSTIIFMLSDQPKNSKISNEHSGSYGPQSNFLRSCRSADILNSSSDRHEGLINVSLSTLDPLTRSSQEEEKDLLYKGNNEKPKTETNIHLISQMGSDNWRSLSEVIHRENLHHSSENILYRCTFCDTTTITVILHYILEKLKGFESEINRAFCMRLLNLLVVFGHKTLNQILALGQKLLKKKHSSKSLKWLRDFKVNECPNSHLRNSCTDYFSLKKNVSKNFFRCGEILLNRIEIIYKLMHKDLFSIIIDDLSNAQNSVKSYDVVPVIISEEINLLGNIFYSDLLSLFWVYVEWYLIWIVKYFDTSDIIENATVISILGENSKIHNLEMRRGSQTDIFKNPMLLYIVIESALTIFSNPKVSRWIYSNCDSNMDFPVYLLEDFVYFLSKLGCSTSMQRVGMRCSRTLLVILYQTLPQYLSINPHTINHRSISLRSQSEEKIRRSRKLLRDECISVLNLSIDEGLKKARELKFIPDNPTEDDLAAFFYSNPGIDRFSLWEYLSNPSMVSMLGRFISLFEFNSLSIVTAIRILVDRIQMSGESQQISRLLEAFSVTYFNQNKDIKTFVPKNTDSVYVLSYSIVMLNTDLHNAQVLDFKNNLRGMNDHSDYPAELLHEIYESVNKHEIKGSCCEYDRYFSMSGYSRKSMEPLMDISECQSVLWRKEISSIIWRPVLVAIHTAFASSSEVNSLKYASEAYRRLSQIASVYNNTELIDMVVYSLVSLSGMPTHDPLSVFSYKEGCAHCDNVESYTTSNTFSAHLDSWSINFGAHPVFQMAVILLFEILSSHFNIIESSWPQIITLVQYLFLHALLPRQLMVQRDLILGETRVKLVYPEVEFKKKSKRPTIKSLSAIKDPYYFKSSISKVLGMSTHRNDEFSPVNKSSENIQWCNRAMNCIFSCNIYNIVENSRYYSEKTLMLLYKSIVNSSFVYIPIESDKSTQSSSDETTLLSRSTINDTSNQRLHSDKRRFYHPAAAFNLNILLEITIRNIGRCPKLLSMLEEHVMSIIENAKSCPDHLLLGSLTCLFSIILKLLHKNGFVKHAVGLANKITVIPMTENMHIRDTVMVGVYMILNSLTATTRPIIDKELNVWNILNNFIKPNFTELERTETILISSFI